MGPTTVNNLPAHVLLVHIVVVFIPLAALTLVCSAVWPAARRRLGIATPIISLLALIAVPLTIDAGEWLEKRVQPDPLVSAHADLGDTMLPWTIGLFVVAVAVWLLHRRAPIEGTRRWLPAATVVAGVLSVAVAGGSVVQVYRIGDSGAQAAWHDNFSANPVPSNGK